MNKITIDEHSIVGSELLGILRRNGQIPSLVREIILDKELASVHLEEDLEEELVTDFRKQRKLESEEAYVDFLSSKYLDETLLKQVLTQPERIVRYREERWGPRAQSLYLKHKDRYDLITYRRLQCSDEDVMQEVFFRLKDREEGWESLARQFHPNDPNANGSIGPVPVGDLEPTLLEALRQAGVGTLIRPLKVDGQVIVAELESFEASKFDDELRQKILRREFERWIEEESTKMLNKISFTR